MPTMTAILMKFWKLTKREEKLSTETDALKAEQNKVSKQIPIMKKKGENTDAVMAEMKEISEKSRMTMQL